MTTLLPRILAALILVFATYNPLGYSFTTWAPRAWSEGAQPFVALAALVLIIGYVIFVRATLRSIGALGALLVGAFVGIVTWLLVDLGVIAAGDSVLTWTGLIAVSLILGVGLSWSLIRRRLSGQVDMDDVDEE